MFFPFFLLWFLLSLSTSQPSMFSLLAHFPPWNPHDISQYIFFVMSVLYIKYVRDGKTAQQGMAFTDQPNG